MSRITFGYTRTSTGEQTHDSQLDALTAAGATRIYTDTVSGTVAAMERVEFSKLMDAAREGDEVLIVRLDRLGRSVPDILATIELLEARGVALRSLDGIVTSGPMGRMVTTVLGAVAALERDLILERSRAGMAAARARGTHMGRPHSLSPEQRAHARELRAGGMSYARIAQALGTSKRTAVRVTRDVEVGGSLAAAELDTQRRISARAAKRLTLLPGDRAVADNL